jgi:xylulokinase
VKVLLGIDSGTYSTKGVACLPDGTVLAQARAEHDVAVTRAGYAEQDADGVWWRDFSAVARELVGALPRGAEIAALGVSSCGPCLVPVDDQARPLRAGMLYGVDTRSDPQIAELERRIGRRAIIRLSGSSLTSQYVGPKILWILENEPDVYRRTAKFLTATGYLLLRLTGEAVVDQHHASYFAPYVDLRRGRWDLRHDDGRIDEGRLPRICWSDEVVGSVRGAASSETGIPAGTPVVAGSTDGLTEALSVGVTEPGDLMLTYGSAGIVMLVLDRPRPGRNLWLSAGAFPGEYVLAGGASTTGSITTWFRRELARELIQADAQTIGEAHAKLTDEAERSVVGAHGLLLLPYFSGERSPLSDSRARGVFAGLSLAHTRGDMYRAALEASGFAMRHTIEAMRSTGAPIGRAVAVGGGSESKLWLRIVSDIIGLPQEVPAFRIGASYGDAFLAGVGAGVIADRTSLASEWMRPAGRVEPDRGNVARYDDLYGLYRELYGRTAGTVHALVAFEESRRDEERLALGAERGG